MAASLSSRFGLVHGDISFDIGMASSRSAFECINVVALFSDHGVQVRRHLERLLFVVCSLPWRYTPICNVYLHLIDRMRLAYLLLVVLNKNICSNASEIAFMRMTETYI